MKNNVILPKISLADALRGISQMAVKYWNALFEGVPVNPPVPVVLVGAPGIGKTLGLKKVARDLGVPCYYLSMASLVREAIEIPAVGGDPAAGKFVQYVRHHVLDEINALPGIGKALLVLDEINLVKDPSLLSMILGIMDSRETPGGLKLPQGLMIVSACNTSRDNLLAVNLWQYTATNSRFNWWEVYLSPVDVLNVLPALEGQVGWSREVVEFIRHFPECVIETPGAFRTWGKVSWNLLVQIPAEEATKPLPEEIRQRFLRFLEGKVDEENPLSLQEKILSAVRRGEKKLSPKSRRELQSAPSEVQIAIFNSVAEEIGISSAIEFFAE